MAILPAVFHWPAHVPASGFGRSLRGALANLVAALICYAIYRVERRRMDIRRALTLVFLIFLLATTVNFLHKVIVDYGVDHFRTSSNLSWQIRMQNAAIDLNRDALPHSYRFLPNAVVRWMEMGGYNFESARNFYRLFFGLLIFYALYRYARLYTDYLGAIIAMLFTAMIFPVSFVHYAGQLTDPLSHLSFLLCFIFLQIDDFGYFLCAMLIGSLAKETVLAMAGYYVLFRRGDRNYGVRSIAACVSAGIVYLSVRLLVLHGKMGYRQVSGVPLTHVIENWKLTLWVPLVALTAGALLPLLVLGWRETPAVLKKQVFYWISVIFISSLFFSWLVEVRNFMPVVFLLSVVAGNFLSRVVGPEPSAATL